MQAGWIKKLAAHSKTFLGGLVKSRISSAVKYDCFKLDDSGNCIIRKTWLHLFDLKRNLG